MKFNLDTCMSNVGFRMYTDLKDFENDIEQMIPLKNVRASDIDNLLESYGLKYYDLPQTIKDKINEIDLMD